MARPREFDEDHALDRCIELFRSRSYAGTSTQDLCEGAGVSRSTLYNAFRSKSALHLLALRRYVDQGAVRRASLLDDADTGREQLERVMLAAVQEQQQAPDRRSCLALHAAIEIGLSDPDVAEVVRDHLAAFSGLLADVVDRGQRDGSITSTLTPTALAAVLLSALNGLQVQGRVAADPESLGQVVTDLLRLV